MIRVGKANISESATSENVAELILMLTLTSGIVLVAGACQVMLEQSHPSYTFTTTSMYA